MLRYNRTNRLHPRLFHLFSLWCYVTQQAFWAKHNFSFPNECPSHLHLTPTPPPSCPLSTSSVLIDRMLFQCAVPENIHTPSHGRFLSLKPPTPPLWKFHFTVIHWAFETPLPLGIFINLPRGGHGYFLERHHFATEYPFFT